MILIHQSRVISMSAQFPLVIFEFYEQKMHLLIVKIQFQDLNNPIDDSKLAQYKTSDPEESQISGC